ncbi:MAG: M1 family metallopeptidase [Bacteroidia bacterium]
MKRAVLIFLVFVFSKPAKAQDYFQQEVNYTINVKLDDVKSELTADESIEYINNSPFDLPFIYMHLWPNAYKNNSTCLAKQLLASGNTKLYYASADEKGYIDQLDFKVNGQAVKWELLKDTIDICKIFLSEPLKSGAKITITTPFHVKIPSGEISRLGHVGQSYQITQWYPKPAVFDRHGWNQIPYLNQGEFYSEFGSFDVSITVPKNYVLGATGDMVDGEKELAWLDENVKATEATKNFDSKDLSFPPSSSEMKTLRFRQKNVHDFAWFCDKRYHVLKGEITTPHTKNKVTTWTMFTNAEGNLWKNSIQYMNDAVYYYSLWNGDYPYAQCTAVDGTISAGGGMEYPNITVIGSSGSAFSLDVVITHEVGHNWFYGMLGSNERMHAWMDEGINSFNENRYVETKYPDRKLIGDIGDGPIGKRFDLSRYKHKSQYDLSYLYAAAKNEDQPIELPAWEYTEINYGGIVYSKTAIVLDYLMAYLGEEEMDKAMQAYFDEWHFKHPMPEDFRRSLEKATGKNLGWLFDDLINSTRKLDYKIAFTKKNSDGSYDIGVKNTGEIAGPVFIQGIKDGKLIGEVTYDGFKGKQALTFPPSDIDYFKIDLREDMPEINRNNNRIKTKGLFKKVEPLKLQFLGSLDNPDKTQLFWTPVAGWNNYDKWMFGLALYNNILPQKRFEFELMPMYSSSIKNFCGYGHAALNFFPDRCFQGISVGVEAKRYAYTNIPIDLNYTKIAPELKLSIKKAHLNSPGSFDIRYRNITIFKEFYAFGLSPYETVIYNPDAARGYESNNYDVLDLTYAHYDAINPFNITLDIQHTKDVVSIVKAGLTVNYSYNFKKKNKGIDVRLFAGSFIDNGSNIHASPYRFNLSGQAGYQDYLFDGTYLGRSEYPGVPGTAEILSQQFAETDGAFKFFSPLGRSSTWIAALNVKSSLGNMKLPVRLYADIGTGDPKGYTDEKFLYDAGVCLSFRKNIFEIYFPCLLSQDFEKYKEANDISYAETIRFTLNLNLVNPFKLIRNFSL